MKHGTRLIRFKDGSTRIEDAYPFEHVESGMISTRRDVEHVIFDCGGACGGGPTHIDKDGEVYDGRL